MNDKLICSLENPSIRKVLNDILNQLDNKPFSQRTNNINISINEKNFKELYEPSEELNAEYLEKDIENLVKEGLFSFSKNTKSFLPLIQRNVKLVFNKNYEDKIRAFYKRKQIINTWLEALGNINNLDDELLTFLKNNPIKIKGKTDKEVLERFSSWFDKPKKSNSLREESARCFWGMSKVFETKEGLNRFLNLDAMPVLLQVHAKSENSKDILFIENLETFYNCISSKNKIFENMILIYASGYKTSAKRVRKKIGSKMFFSYNSKFSDKSRDDFILWFYEENDSNLNTYFWGDLDYEGMNILSSLKKNFLNIKAWEPAYEKMFELVSDDFGHTPLMAGKEKQRGIIDDDCKYTILLNEKEIFLDQECLDISLL